MKKDIEIELRGPLSKEEYDNIKSFLSKNSRTLSKKDRVLIDYSTFLPGGLRDRKTDIRLRATNGIPEIIVKLGEWGESEQRKELSVLAQKESFDTLVQIFSVLGYKKGMLCVRKSDVFEYKNIEFALVEVPGHSYYYEAEKMAESGEDLDQLTKELNHVCQDLNLKVFSKEDFFSYVELLNREANVIFEADKSPNQYFKENYGL